MTKKCFAAILSAQELARKIEGIVNGLEKPQKSYAATKEIVALNAKFIEDFGNVDPAWKPKGAKTGKSMTKKCFACIKTSQENATKVAEMTADLKMVTAIKTLKAIAEINAKFLADFGSVDPAWKPAEEAKTDGIVIPEASAEVKANYEIPAYAMAEDVIE